LLGFLSVLFCAESRADDKAERDKRELYLKGNELWGYYCSNCHNAPPSADRAPHEWDIIALHMRTRANLPAEHERAIFEYLRSH
jgi:hypothetical protein